MVSIMHSVWHLDRYLLRGQKGAPVSEIVHACVSPLCKIIPWRRHRYPHDNGSHCWAEQTLALRSADRGPPRVGKRHKLAGGRTLTLRHCHHCRPFHPASGRGAYTKSPCRCCLTSDEMASLCSPSHRSLVSWRGAGEP